MAKDKVRFELAQPHSWAYVQVGEKSVEVGQDGYETSDQAEIDALSNLAGVTVKTGNAKKGE